MPPSPLPPSPLTLCLTLADTATLSTVTHCLTSMCPPISLWQPPTRRCTRCSRTTSPSRVTSRSPGAVRATTPRQQMASSHPQPAAAARNLPLASSSRTRRCPPSQRAQWGGVHRRVGLARQASRSWTRREPARACDKPARVDGSRAASPRRRWRFVSTRTSAPVRPHVCCAGGDALLLIRVVGVGG